MSQSFNDLYFFGPYRLAPGERRLWRGEACVHLTPRAFDLLVLLVQSAGHLLCRDQLIKQLWGNTLVEEHGLTWNISALRRALGDDGEAPVYIETVRGHGYRFIAPVHAGDNATPAPDETPAPATEDAAAPQAPSAPSADREARSHRLRPAWLLLPAAILAVAALALFVGHRRAPATTAGRGDIARPTIAVLGFRNLSHDHDYDWIGDALVEMLGTELATGDAADISPQSDVVRTLHELALDNTTSPPTPEQTILLHRALGVDATIAGAYLRQDGAGTPHIRVDVRMRLDTDSGRARTVTFSATGDDLFGLVSQLGRKMRGRLGMARLDPAQKGEFMASMPASTDAAADYASGLSALAAGQTLLARTLLQQVTREEPDFPLAHSALARVWLDLGDNHDAAEEARQALRHSAGLSYAQRLLLLGLKAEAEHDWDQAIDAYRKRFETNPSSLNLGLMLVRAQVKAGRYVDARETLDQLVKLPPPFGNDPRIMLASANLHGETGKYDAYYSDAMRAAARADALGQDAVQAHALSDAAHARIRQNDYTGALQLARRARDMFAHSQPDSLDAGINLQRIGIAYGGMGQYDKAISAYDDANELFARIGNRYWQAASLNNIAGIHFHRDQLDLARHRYEQALALFRDLHRDEAVAVVLNNLSAVVSGQGHLDQAVDYEKQALAIRRELGTPRTVASTLLNLGLQTYALGELDASEKYLREARSIYLAQHAPNDASDAVSALADLARTRNRVEDARKGYQQALEMRRGAHVVTSVAWSQRDLAELDLDTGHPARALRRVRAALPVFEKAQARSDAISARADMALALADMDRLDEARRLAAQLDTQMPTVANRGVRLGLQLTRARLALRLDDPALAHRLLADTLRQAQAMKMKSRSYPARLQMLQLQARHGLDATTRKQAERLIRDASHDGYSRIAAQARGILATPPRTS